MTVLWTSDEIAEATGGTASASFEVTGVTFDSREVEPGDLFVAMPGTAYDGHRFVDGAFDAGASGAIVSQPVDRPHVLVEDTARALEDLGRAARARTSATIIGVTGSVGKTSTKEALFAALDRNAPEQVHRSVKSYNNHTGVPLSLARMPRDSRFAVLEMGMNNAGEIRALTAMVRPHLAAITAIAPAHIENLGSMEGIADAKAEIFEGLEPDGIAIIPNDTPHRDRLVRAARRFAAQIVSFGTGDADVHAVHAGRAEQGGSLVTAALLNSEITFTISQRGEHWVSNALLVLACIEALGADPAVGALGLADLGGLKGRGERHIVKVDGGEALVIDESYNANPASMAATIKSLGAEREVDRRIAVLGPMRELGPTSDQLHADLAPILVEAGVGEVVLVGEETMPLERALNSASHVTRASSADDAAERVRAMLRPRDAVLVKASNSIGLSRVVDRLTKGLD
ncbi:UDP-N-acetylmuramoyl-tripeptide--D-alanyl-D-alanine ligase [Sphingomonas sinipercae]|uniref:UDP-N-acetylmuramoyl-tripeptide--D-alanyl-D-alanine ligase n=1 Tax=Sphingomonas sinipercae TaxID=2714944 RepID=A0A6G7ZQ71_9SPHN|nr:UDP-N-acetylmuramoyl-tripeptide--D-alanyl-D-alanine ligase [Sphingomonas sinipercae]QIL03078.1 UDP-N-acetylmuramoyl-tripeptide--D-alanyl-D-alanine ligase [Sphingomonas sinipercae]